MTGGGEGWGEDSKGSLGNGSGASTSGDDESSGGGADGTTAAEEDGGGRRRRAIGDAAPREARGT